MTSLDRDLKHTLVIEQELWREGPPHSLFTQLRHECPVHWSEQIPGLPQEPGFWSVATAKDTETVSRDWETYSSELEGVFAVAPAVPIELMRTMLIAMDPPRHSRVKALLQAGFTPERIARQEHDIRAIVAGVLDRFDGTDTCDLVTDIAQPCVARVIGQFMGIPEEDDERWAVIVNSMAGARDPDLNPDGIQGILGSSFPELIMRSRQLIAERRRHPTDDLTSLLVHAVVDGERLSDEEIVMEFFGLVAAGHDSTKATYCSGMLALVTDPDQRQLVLDNPSLIPGVVEESLRMFPAFAHFRRTATRDVELGGQSIKKGDKVVMWYVSSNRDEACYENPHCFDVRRNPRHQAFGAGGRHFCLGAALARLELKILFEETLSRFPAMELAGTPKPVQSPGLNQLKTFPVRLRASS